MARRKIGIKARLLAVALVPSLALVGFAYQAAAPRQEAARRADDVRAQTRSLATLVNMRAAAVAERVASEIIVRTRSYGLSAAQVSVFLGFDVTRVVEAQRARVAAAAAGAGEVGTAAERDLGTIRAQVDDGTATQEQLAARFNAIDDSLDALLTAQMHTLVTSVDAVADAAPLQHSIAAVVDSSAVFAAGREVQAQLAFMLISQGDERVTNQLGLADARARYLVNKEHLSTVIGPHGADAEANRVVDPSVVSLDDAARRALQPDGATTADLPSLQRHPERMAKIFAGTVDYQVLLYETVKATTDDLVEVAGVTKAHADKDFRDSTRTAAVVVALAILWALLNAFSLARPLRRLTKAVDSVRQGDLDTALRVGNHTREIAKVEDALVDLVDTMRVVERQAKALAAGRLDEPVLARSVPGALGDSLQQSVERLSTSISEERTLRARLEFAASHDVLTALPNRFAALEHLDGLLSRALRHGRSTSLLFLDLDDFKRANDGHGHAVGDQLLVEVATRLKAIVRTGDLLARLGGDEFVIMFDDVPGGDGAITLARRIVEVLDHPFVFDGTRFSVGASVGVARADDGSITGEDLLKQADIALYRAKDKGKGRVEVFDHELQRQLDERAELEHALAAALAGDELVLHYQPVVAAATGRPVSVEALVRWNRPGHGLVPPAAFIPIAEQSNLICDLGRWVLDAATTDAAGWNDGNGVGALEVAVNVSGRHVLSGSLVDDVRRALDRSGIEPARLTIEITETMLLLDLPIVIDQLEELRRMGVSVAIDDYGTGYTSLNHLRFLPADVIKIDRSFVSQLDRPREAPLVRLINDIGHTLGLVVVAEGVETAEQRQQLVDMGCDRLQGYHLSRPIPLDDLVAWVRGAPVAAVAAGADAQSSSR